MSNKLVEEVPGIDLGYRPASYFWPLGTGDPPAGHYPDRMLEFVVSFESQFYPDIDQLYRKRIVAWAEQKSDKAAIVDAYFSHRWESGNGCGFFNLIDRAEHPGGFEVAGFPHRAALSERTVAKNSHRGGLLDCLQ